MNDDKPYSLGDQPIEDQHYGVMNDLADFLDKAFNGPAKKRDRTTGFILMVFPFGEDTGEHRCNYISNARRSDVVQLLKDQLKRFADQDKSKS